MKRYYWNYFCLFLNEIIELTEERYEKIKRSHPEVILDLIDEFEATIVNPDFVILKLDQFKFVKRVSYRGKTKWLAVIVNYDKSLSRYWVVTAYVSRLPIKGEIIYG